jgi:hypothetical protein
MSEGHDAERPTLRRPPPRLSERDDGPPGLVLWLARLARRVDRSLETVRFVRAGVAIVAGIVLAIGGAVADATIHRGVESGADPPVVRQATGRTLATNVDLTRYSPSQLPAVVAALQANGFRYVRQSFAWSEIEPAPGAFAWERYDAIVDELDRRGLVPVAVLHRAPPWARPAGAGAAFDAAPVDPEAYARFVQELAARYGDRAPIVQVWDRPNREDRWGTAPDPVAYAGLLAVAANAARAANPNVTVVLAEFDPSPRPEASAADLVFLKRVYAAGAAPFFDVVAARVDGGDRSPYDRRVSASAPGLSRVVLFREAMAAAGDEDKPVWATHYGWRHAGPGEAGLSPAAQAAWSVAGIERARAEWPWMGPMFAWGFAPGPDLGGDVPTEAALLGPDAAPTALLTALGAFHAAGGDGVAATGFLPVGARQWTYEGNWGAQHLGAETYRTTNEVGARLTVRFRGTGAAARVRLSADAAPLAATLDGRPIPLNLRSAQATDIETTLASGLPDGDHVVTIALTEPGQFTIGGLIVERDVPLRWPVALLVGAGIGLLAWGLRLLLFTVAERAGRLQRRAADLWPELPIMPDWTPSRRA